MVIRLKNAHVLDGEKFLLRDLELPCMEPRSAHEIGRAHV